MNLPSLSFIYREASKTGRRFPFAIFAAILAAGCTVYMIGLGYTERQHSEFIYNIILVSVLGIAGFTVITLTAEKQYIEPLWLWVGRVTGLLLLVIYYYSLPENSFDGLAKIGIRYALFFLGVHLLVAIAPFWKRDEINGFWQFNKTLFLRILTALLYSHVLYLGLVVAMLSIDNLFGVDMPNEWYAQLWVLIIGLFNTWFFLSGIPDDLNHLEKQKEYPKGLKIFTQYILIPLVVIYLIILYFYMGKIIITWTWPEGWVAILVLSFSIAGIFSLLLLYPIQDKIENRWIKSFSIYYYISLLPLVIMLLLAIWRRISEYGITENRYFVLVLGLWLTVTVIYFIFSSTKNIKVIPASLCIITFLVSFGPWGAFSISENSQINRLQNLLDKNSILIGGKIHPAVKTVPQEDSKEISAIVRYLSDVHGLQGIQPWFDKDLSSLALNSQDSTTSGKRRTQPQEVVKLMGLKYFNRWNSAAISAEHVFLSKSSNVIPIHNYEWLVSNRVFSPTRDTSAVNIGLHKLVFKLHPDSLQFTIEDQQNDLSGLQIDLKPIIDGLLRDYPGQNYNIPQNKMSVDAENDWLEIRLNLTRLNIHKVDQVWQAGNVQSNILIKIK